MQAPVLLPPLTHFIDGKFVGSRGGRTFPIVQPATEEIICRVAEGDADDIDAAVVAARRALSGKWGNLGPAGRRSLLLRLADLIEKNGDDLGRLESFNNGGPVAFQTAVVKAAPDDIRYAAGWCGKVDGHVPDVGPGFVAYTRKEPIGVCAMILPWNVPLWATIVKLAPCLAMGNTAVIKPSELTPLTTMRLMELINEAGFPNGVVNVVNGFGPVVGSALASHMDVDKIAFTGSTPVGRAIASAASASNLKRVQLELGGKSPLIVFPDADLDMAAGLAQVALFTNNGQLCTAGSRTFVHESVYDAFVAKAVAHARAAKVGHQLDAANTQGPSVDKKQFAKVLDYIEKGKQQGATLQCGGGRAASKGYFVQPTIFSNVTDDMVIAKEEIFGPVQSILKFSSTQEVIERCNSSPYGLAAGIITSDVNTMLTVSNALKAGTVWVNTYHTIFNNMEFGGFKQSGFGREGGYEGVQEWTITKSVITRISAL